MKIAKIKPYLITGAVTLVTMLVVNTLAKRVGVVAQIKNKVETGL